MACAESVNRVRAHLLAQLVCLGRHTLTGLLATNGQLQKDWSADYRLFESTLSRELCARDALCAALGTEQAARWI
jgi:hypothetical protein